jgi:hypothetical protein
MCNPSKLVDVEKLLDQCDGYYPPLLAAVQCKYPQYKLRAVQADGGEGGGAGGSHNKQKAE